MSNIKKFPMAVLPGWPFAPSSTPGAQFEQRQFEPDSLNNLNIYTLNIVLDSIQPMWGLGLPVA
jgi:hypothetical protein